MTKELENKLHFDALPKMAGQLLEVTQTMPELFDNHFDLIHGNIRVSFKGGMIDILTFHDRMIGFGDDDYRSLSFIYNNKSYSANADRDSASVYEHDLQTDKGQLIDWRDMEDIFYQFLDHFEHNL